ncbi:hypothetical protein [Peribacillus deserti]|uniref:Uncharacterized protein n=1 Tax=Peribacillus deserti TaxID=673318 RepID=A0A2N5LZK7_9BACI|nr:hypothetical protein [Peribacillus deserti]PLT27544.1 hypothetical protein CUU66_23300 [Peribacillus deserti]
MKALVGIFIAVQAILTGLILHGMHSISDSIIMASVHQKRDDFTISWGGNLDNTTYILLGVIVIAGVYLMVADILKNGK